MFGGIFKKVGKMKLPKENNYLLNKNLAESLEFGKKRIESKNFNKNLLNLNKNNSKDNFVFDLWKPSYILRRWWIQNLPMELAASRLKFKSNAKRHPYNLEVLKNFDKKVHNPIAVFKWNNKNHIILTDLTNIDWKNFVSIVRVVNNGYKNKINSIRSIYGRTINQIKRDIENITFLNKTKMKKWISDNDLDEKEFDFLWE